MTTNNPDGVTESGQAARGACGIISNWFTAWPNWANGASVFQVGSGIYVFTVTNAYLQ